jgi:zinc transporter, ZIP family
MLVNFFEELNIPLLQAFAGGLFIALFNTFGALLILIWRKPSALTLNFGLGLAAGVMLCASFTSLIIPGLKYGGVVPVLVGLSLGSLILGLADQLIPHLHIAKGPEGGNSPLRAVWLFIIAITLHNMPEGLAVGVGFGSGNVSGAIALMFAIGIQNIPEGFAVAISARNAGLASTSYAMFSGIRSGLVEIPLAVLGAWFVQGALPILPYAMGFAAGAMLYVISSEIIPETHRNGQHRIATAGLLIGIMLMLYLDISLA